MNKCDFMSIDPEILHGRPVFKNSRVPIDALFDYLETGETLEQFFADFPTVNREYAEAALEFSKQLLVA